MIEVFAEYRGFNQRIDLLFRQVQKRKEYCAAPLTFVEHEEGAVLEPTASIDHATGQQLMDELWRCGIRPTEGTGSAGSLAATERHLADMQKIAFDLLGSRTA